MNSMKGLRCFINAMGFLTVAIVISDAAFGQTLHPIQADGKVGYADSTGRIVIEPQFDDIGAVGWFVGDVAIVRLHGKYGLLDRSGAYRLTPRYDMIEPIDAGFAVFKQRTGYGLIDTNGRVIVDALYDEINNWLADGVARIRRGGLYGYIDGSGRELLAPCFDVALPFVDGFAVVGRRNLYGIVALDGNVVVKPRFGAVQNFSEGLAAVNVGGRQEVVRQGDPPTVGVVGGKWGFIDTTGDMVVDARYDLVGGFASGLAPVSIGGHWGFVDRHGSMIIPLKFQNAGGFSQGLAPADSAGLWGFIDTRGRIVIPFQFHDAWGFTEGLAPVKVAEKWGYVDLHGAIVIPPMFDAAYSFSKGVAEVRLTGGKRASIDTSGHVVNPSH